MNQRTPAPAPPRRSTRLGAAITVYGAVCAAVIGAVLAAATWIRGDQPIDDRGSDSSEKAFMVILAITIGTAVTAAAVAFVATKTALFK